MPEIKRVDVINDLIANLEQLLGIELLEYNNKNYLAADLVQGPDASTTKQELIKSSLALLQKELSNP